MPLPESAKVVIFAGKLSGIAEEMGEVLRRSSFSPNIKERRDYSCAIFDRKGDLLAQAAHIPVHLGSMHFAVKEAIKQLELGPGDACCLNDPYRGGTHLPDLTLISAYFPPGAANPLFYLASRAHHADIGGAKAASMGLATSIEEEGTVIGPTIVYKKGRPVKKTFNRILSGAVNRPEREGDISAQFAAIRRGEKRLSDFTAAYSKSELKRLIKTLYDYSESLQEATIRRFPDGEYSFTDYLDSDGITDENLAICCRIAINDGHATIDFAGTAPAARGPVNAPISVTTAAAFYAFSAVAGGGIPPNAGCLKPISVSAPEGCLVNAKYPSAVAAGNVETSQRIVDCIFGALANAAPDRIPAAGQGTMNNISFAGSFRGTEFSYYETIGGGMGASANAKGSSAVHVHMTNTLNTPIEVIERVYPFRILKYGVRYDSGGIGRTVGGDGIVRAFRFTGSCRASILSERRILRPYGLAGGGPGQPGINILFRKNRRITLPAKCELVFRRGDELIIETPGGGGYGEHAIRKKDAGKPWL